MLGVVGKCDGFSRSRFRCFSAIFGRVRSSAKGESALTVDDFYKATDDVAQSGNDAEIRCSDVLKLVVSRKEAKSQVNTVFKQLKQVVERF